MRASPSLLYLALAALGACVDGRTEIQVPAGRLGPAAGTPATPSPQAPAPGVTPVPTGITPALAAPGGRIVLRGSGLQVARGRDLKVTVGGVQARLLDPDPSQEASATAGELLAVEVPERAADGSVVVAAGEVRAEPVRFSLVTALRLEGPSRITYGASGVVKVFATTREAGETQTDLIPPLPQDSWSVQRRDGAFTLRPLRFGSFDFVVGAGPIRADLRIDTDAWAGTRPLPVLALKGFAVGAGRVWFTDGASLYRSDDAGTGWVREPGAAAPGQVLSGVAADQAGQVYYGDRASVRVMAGGASTVLCGDPAASGSVDGDAATARFQRVQHLVQAFRGPLYVTDGVGSLVVRRVYPDGTVATLGGKGLAEGSTPTPLDRFGATRDHAFWLTGAGTFLVADAESGSVKRGQTTDLVPGAMAIAPDGRQYVASRTTIFKQRQPLSPRRGKRSETLIPASFRSQQPFESLAEMAFDPEGHLWVVAERPASGGLTVEHFGLPGAE